MINALVLTNHGLFTMYMQVERMTGAIAAFRGRLCVVYMFENLSIYSEIWKYENLPGVGDSHKFKVVKFLKWQIQENLAV